MTPAEKSARLDRVLQFLDLGLQAFNGRDDDMSGIGRTALRIAKSELLILKDELLLEEAKVHNHNTSTPPPARPRRKKKP